MVIAVNTRLLLSSRMEGIARYTYEVLQRMVEAHPEDQFLFLFDRPYDQRFIFGDNVKAIVVRPVTRHPVLWYLWLEWSIPRVLKKYQADVFLSMDTYMSLSTPTPTVLVTHDIAYRHYPKHLSYSIRKYYQHYFPKFHKAARRLLAVSAFTADDVAEAYGLDRSKIEVAHNAVPSDFQSPSSIDKGLIRKQYAEGHRFFVYLGSLHPRKNIVGLIRAFEDFRQKAKKDFKLLLIGRMAWNTEEIQRALSQSEWKEDIIHLSNIGEEAKDIVSAAEAMVYISLFEGFGIPILEAMTMGVPVITSNVSSMPEVAGDAALLVNPKDPKAVSQAMLRMVEEEGLRDKLIDKGLERVKAYDWDETAKKVYAACREALT